MGSKRDASEPTIWRMQEMEIKRSGRKAEYDRLILEAIQRTGLGTNRVKKEVLDKMGLGDHAQVIANYRSRLDQAQMRAQEEQAIREIEASRARSRMSDFERCFSQLPSNAPRAVEFKWIENHPAMVIRKPIDGKPIEICLEDIEDAPSKSAVGQLKHWVNEKDAFYKNLMSVAGKKAGTKEGDEAAKAERDRQDDSIDDIKEMLGRVTGGP
mgnify:FL=1